ALLAALFDRKPPTPATAAIVSLLHAVDGLGALLSLNDRGWRWVHARAGEIASGSWVDEYPTALPEVNLAVTTSAVRQVLG
ncbi:GPP34 family phosphoprotein, partial [Mycolicibacterium elephantis]